MTKKLMIIAATCFVALGLTVNPFVKAQDQSHKKGEVDQLIEELKTKHEDVRSHCLEDCDPKQANDMKGGEFTEKVEPQYPAIARAAHASGDVVVLVVIDEEGKVVAAQVVSGHPLLQSAAVKAAKASSFKPFLLAGAPVKVQGTITYKFILN